MLNYRMILEHIVAVLLMGYTLKLIFTIEVFSGIHTIILITSICYSVYVYMVYWDITKN
jgi:hypothetical protein